MFLKLWYWGLDYLYVGKWQLYGFMTRRAKADYVRPDKSAPVAVLLPGIYESWRFMRPIARVLYDHGYSVHVVEKIGYNTGDIPNMAKAVIEYIDEHSLREVALIAHSKGGLIGKYLLMHHNTHGNIHQLVAINTPFGGSMYAYLFPIRSVRVSIPRSTQLAVLQANKAVNNAIASVYSAFDPHIPRNGSYLEGGTNVKLAIHGHFRIMNDKRLHQTVITILGQAKTKTGYNKGMKSEEGAFKVKFFIWPSIIISIVLTILINLLLWFGVSFF